MPSILPRLLEVRQYSLDALAHNARVCSRFARQRSQDVRQPCWRWALVRERLDEGAQTKHSSVARQHQLALLWRGSAWNATLRQWILGELRGEAVLERRHLSVA